MSAPTLREAARRAVFGWGDGAADIAGRMEELADALDALDAPPPGLEGVRRRLEELWEDGVNVGLAHEERSAVWETAERDDMLAELLAMWEAR